MSTASYPCSTYSKSDQTAFSMELNSLISVHTVCKISYQSISFVQADHNCPEWWEKAVLEISNRPLPPHGLNLLGAS